MPKKYRYSRAEAPMCPECKQPAKLIENATIYGGRSYGSGFSWVCLNYPKCDYYVGTHPDGKTPLGGLANGEMREWRHGAHKLFDQLWKGSKSIMTRKSAYAAMRRVMHMDFDEAHIAEFSIDQCKQLILRLREEYPMLT